jgi:hypothetical protein
VACATRSEKEYRGLTSSPSFFCCSLKSRLLCLERFSLTVTPGQHAIRLS